MALNIIGATIRNVSVRFRALAAIQKCPTQKIFENVIKSPPISITPVRNLNFMAPVSGEYIWKSTTSSSNAGKKRGRGKGRGRGFTRYTSRFQVIGEGRKQLILPGLNSQVRVGADMLNVKRGNDDPGWLEKLYASRDANRNTKRRRFDASEHGFSGSKMAGRRIEPPEPIGSQQFINFQSYVLRFERKHILSTLGRVPRTTCTVASGNGNGILGIATSQTTDSKLAPLKAQQRSVKHLMHFKLSDERTIFHDFFTQLGHTKIYVFRRPEGYGLRTHRVIAILCKLIGIKDLTAKIEGSSNPLNVARAFTLGLLQQKTHDQLAEEKKLFLVKISASGFPIIVGTPSHCRTSDQISPDENLDVRQHVFNGKIVHHVQRFESRWINTPGYKTFLKKQEKRRSMEIVRKNTLFHYGELRSHYTDQYPEATGKVQF